jgi:hypothetical protein
VEGKTVPPGKKPSGGAVRAFLPPESCPINGEKLNVQFFTEVLFYSERNISVRTGISDMKETN